MRHYWIDSQFFKENSVLISGDSFHHICEVCRQSESDTFEVLCGDGVAYLVRLTDVRKKDAVAEILDKRSLPQLQKPYIHLAVSIPKLTTFETILEKSVELGVQSITPFVSDFSFVRIVNSEKIKGKQGRWERIIHGAVQQSGRSEPLILNPVTDLTALLKKFNQSDHVEGLFPYEGETPYDIRSAVRDIMLKKPDTIWAFVGSEGGFSQKEVQLFQQFGLKPSTLGDQVLRVETACIVIAGILRYEIGK